jgi:hypothetical protein
MAVIDLKSRLKITLVPFPFLELRPFRFLLEDICPDIYFPRFAVDTNFKRENKVREQSISGILT